MILVREMDFTHCSKWKLNLGSWYLASTPENRPNSEGVMYGVSEFGFPCIQGRGHRHGFHTCGELNLGFGVSRTCLTHWATSLPLLVLKIKPLVWPQTIAELKWGLKLRSRLLQLLQFNSDLIKPPSQILHPTYHQPLISGRVVWKESNLTHGLWPSDSHKISWTIFFLTCQQSNNRTPTPLVYRNKWDDDKKQTDLLVVAAY